MMSRKSGKKWTLIFLASALGTSHHLAWGDDPGTNPNAVVAPTAVQPLVPPTDLSTNVPDLTVTPPAQTPPAQPPAQTAQIPPAQPPAQPDSQPAAKPAPQQFNFTFTDDTNYSPQLNLSQANQVITGFRIDAIRQNPDDAVSPIASVELHGTMYAACASYFSLSSSSSGAMMGFTITDQNGEGQKCVAAAKQAESQGHHLPRVTLAQHFGDQAKMDLTGSSTDGKVGLLYTPYDADHDDGDATQFAAIGANPIQYKSPQTLQAEAASKQEELMEARDELAQSNFTACRDSLDDLKIAYKAITTLHKDLGDAFDYGAAKKELDKAKKALADKEKKKELSDLRAQIKKVKNADEASDLADKLSAFADANPDYASTVANDEMNLAKHMTEISGANSDDYAEAQTIANNVADMDGVSDSDAAKYRAIGRSYQEEGLQAQAQAGVLDASNAGTAFYGLANSIQQDANSDCRTTPNQNASISPACAQSILNYRQLPTLQAAIVKGSQQAQLGGYGLQNSSIAGLNTFGSVSSPMGNWGTGAGALPAAGANNGAWGSAVLNNPAMSSMSMVSPQMYGYRGF